MKKILNSKIIRKYHYMIEVFLWITAIVVMNVLLSGNINKYSRWYIMILIYGAFILFFQGLNVSLRFFYLGKVVCKVRWIAICERGVNIGRYSILWNQIDCFKWDNDIGQHEYGMTFHLTKKLNGLIGQIKLANGMYELRQFVKREDKDKIREALKGKIKEI